MTSGSDGDDKLIFIDERDAEGIGDERAWSILIADDEPEVHHATLIAMRGVLVEGRKLEFLHAYSASEAEQILAKRSDLSIILLDVVMETNDAGLHLVRHIREILGNHIIRIILRTGQPGYAPEIDTIKAYDINDYKTKTELTRTRLFTSITVAIRAYWQAHQLEANRRGLESIVAASSELSKPIGLRRLAQGVVTQLCALLGIDEEGIVCATDADLNGSAHIIAAAGRYSGWMGHPLHAVPDARVRHALEICLAERAHRFSQVTCLFFPITDIKSVVIFVDVSHPLSDVDHHLLRVFSANILVAFKNCDLYQTVNDLAFEDQLTGLANRNGFVAQIARRQSSDDIIALVDLDGFSDINSALDQDFGDSVLRSVAARMRSAFPQSVHLGRIGADTFALMGPEKLIAPEVIASLFSAPFPVGEENLRLSATTGFVQIENPAPEEVELLKFAATALKQAKNVNRGKALYFEPCLAEDARSRMLMLSRLRLAFSEERLYSVYQPFVDLRTGKVVGGESLLRWKTSEGEFIPPDRFIPFAEKAGLMVPIGQWVMRSAFQFLSRLVSLGHLDFRMAINISYSQFREPDFADSVFSLMQSHGVQPENVELELTESVAIDNVEMISGKLEILRAAGVSIALDDFGTGYSSLNLLRQLKVDRIKIDRSFVPSESHSHGIPEIASLVLQLAQQLGTKTTAEGIETLTQQAHMRELGCQEGQGYFFSRPLLQDQFEAFLC